MSPSIVICDDEPDIAEVLGDRLEAEGYRVLIVDSARGCYASVSENPPDLILMDVQMPEISGIEALTELKSRHPRIPVLMVSASTTREVARDAEAKGASGFLLKPYEPAELMEKIRKIIGEP
jgi:two-component system response regulator FlrC